MSPRLADTLYGGVRGLLTTLDAAGSTYSLLTGRHSVGGSAMRSAMGMTGRYRRLGYLLGAAAGVATQVVYYPAALLAGAAANILLAGASRYTPAKTPLLDPI
ncbi:hypothetical protein CMO91_01975 [Candidatus Woesearchaeota archaeon]|nr:hypothetical protein [Candidatus Woesearchaeota archaeon]